MWSWLSGLARRRLVGSGSAASAYMGGAGLVPGWASYRGLCRLMRLNSFQPEQIEAQPGEWQRVCTQVTQKYAKAERNCGLRLPPRPMPSLPFVDEFLRTASQILWTLHHEEATSVLTSVVASITRMTELTKSLTALVKLSEAQANGST